MAPAAVTAVAVVPPAAPAAWQACNQSAEPGPMPGVGFAPHVGRLIAYIIDAFIIGVVVTIVAIILTPLLVAGADSENTGAIAAAVFLYVFVVLLVSVSYFPFFWARGGQTPGMRFFRLRVVSDADGSRISGGTAVIRLIGLWISFLVFYLGIIWILVDERRRGWHDLHRRHRRHPPALSPASRGDARRTARRSRVRRCRRATGCSRSPTGPTCVASWACSTRPCGRSSCSTTRSRTRSGTTCSRTSPGSSAGCSTPLATSSRASTRRRSAWDGTDAGLPHGWDDQFRRSVDDVTRGRPPDTLGALQIVVGPDRQGSGYSAVMLASMRANARLHGFRALIACVRPNRKAEHPDVAHRGVCPPDPRDGLPEDPWLRVHVRAGGRIVRAVPDSMTVEGTIDEWREWTGLDFPTSGPYLPEGAASPVDIDLETDRGVYHDPNVWVVHDLG